MSPVKMNLISLKCMLFIFFGGLGCLLPGLALAGHKVGLHTDELYVVSVVAPVVAVLGPLLAGPVADRLGAPAQGSTARYGRYMRLMLVLAMLLGAALYTALLYVPPVSRQHERNPPVKFVCTPEGSTVLQDQCQEIPCYKWPEDNRGTLFLSNCRHDCGGSEALLPANTTSEEDYGESPEDEGSVNLVSRNRSVDLLSSADLPQLCLDHAGQTVCHYYMKYSRQFPINASLAPSAPPRDREQWCAYSILDHITCKPPPLPPTDVLSHNCSVVCDLDEPYNHSASLLLESECRHTFGDPQLTFWTFLLVRSVADVFPTTVLALLASCLVVAARDTPALLCRQLVSALLGFALVPPLVDFIVDVLPEDPRTLADKHVFSYGYYIITFAGLSVISALIILFDRSMPLSPVDYHLQTGPGHLTLKSAGGEIGALSLVLVLLGMLSTAIDSYIPWESVVLALIPSLLVLWYSTKVVDYCGHSNILIVAFTFYIIRYTGLLIWKEVSVLFLYGALEVFTLVLSWSTAVLYLRHLVPRHFLVTGQSLAIIAFFCIGRFLGSGLGGLLVETAKYSSSPKWDDYFSETLYKVGAVVSAVVASLYFVLYHCCLKHQWRKQSSRQPVPTVRDTNANGTYTPLKIYNPPAKDPQRIRY